MHAEGIDHREVALVRRNMQRRPSLALAFRRVGGMREQLMDDAVVATGGCVEERRLPGVIALVKLDLVRR